MTLKSFLFAGAALCATVPFAARAQDKSPDTTVDASTEGDIIVTARKREETLLDVPVAATAIGGDTLQARGINSVREAAVLSPGLNINSDGTGRAFVAIRGVGVTLVQSVQPGVGLFIDGIYQPNTSYLNNPLLDVARIEVLRGPQGTLYGKNTLGGAINVITRQPGNDFEGRFSASLAGKDNSWMVSGAVSGPIITDKLAIRVAASHREQDGFLRNIVVGGKANPLNTESVNATLRATPSEGVKITVKGYYDWVDGVNTPYARVSGPTDYKRDIEFNTLNRVSFKYRGVNAKVELPLDSLDSTLTLIGAYDARNGSAADGEGDFGPLDLVRLTNSDKLRTKTAELRFDSKWSDSLSSLFGLFYSREETSALAITKINIFPPFPLVNQATNVGKADTYAAFGTLFWNPNDAWEVALGLRYDHEDRAANGTINGVAVPEAKIQSDEVEPRLTVTRHWGPRLMTYASVARGYRGGGFNAVTAPQRTYNGDSAWTYELGSKYVSADRRITISGALFYSDYKDYIGLNSIAPSSTGGLVTVDLNTGDVESYGLELEAMLRPIQAWTISGGLTLMHARLTNTDAYTAVTNRVLSSDRLTFQPDWTANLSTDYAIPVGRGELVLGGGVVGKGKRLAATLNQTTPTLLDSYWLVNASVSWRSGPLELSVFGNNLFKEDYFESYIEKTTLQLAGLPASDLGIVGDSRRVGVRASLKF